MKYSDFKKNIGKAGLTIEKFSDLIKSTPNSISNYASKGKVPKHLAIISTLLVEMEYHKIDYAHLFENMELETFKHRGKNNFKKNITILNKGEVYEK